MKKIFNLVIVFTLLLITPITKINAAGSITRASSATLYPGDTFTIYINSGSTERIYYQFNLESSNSGVASGRTQYVSSEDEASSIALTFTAHSVGTTRIKISADFSETASGSRTNMSGNYVDITVHEKPSSGGSTGGNNSGGSSSGGGSSLGGSSSSGGSSSMGTGSGADTDPTLRTETPEEREAREEREKAQELEARKLIPLVESISIYSESERLKGKEVINLKTEDELFAYSAVLPRNVDEFKLELKPVDDDVVLTYDKMYKLDSGHDKVEIKVKAVQDEVEQEFNITITRHKESDVIISGDDGLKYHLLVDSLIDSKLLELGIERHLFNEAKDDTFYYYEYNGIKFVLSYDDKNIARWLLLNDDGSFMQEAILLFDSEMHAHFIVDVALEDTTTLYGNQYRQEELELSEVIVSLDESIQFNNLVSAWNYNDNGFITHEYVAVQNKDLAAVGDVKIEANDLAYQLVYVGKDAHIQTAFVAFDNQGLNYQHLAYVLLGLLILMMILFIAYWISSQKKIKRLLMRRG